MANKRQQEIPGAEREVDEQIDELCGAYTNRLYERKDLEKLERQSKQALISEMKAKKVKAYKFVDGDFEYTLKLERVTEDKLKCSRREISAGEPVGGEVIEIADWMGEDEPDTTEEE